MSVIITSPLRGWVAPLETVPDAVFADRMMGDGVAIHPLDDTVYAPVDGEVLTLHEAGHAVSLRSVEGVELLIHIGLDTVALCGAGFTPLVAAGQAVLRGDPLIRFDLDAVGLAATSLVTPVIVTNAEAFTITRRASDRPIGACEELMALHAIEPAPLRWAEDDAAIEQRVTLRLPHGIHARPAARIGECVRQFEVEIHLRCGDRRGDARSTVALLALGTRFGDEVVIEARGRDAGSAVAVLAELLASDMGEGAPPTARLGRPARTASATGLPPGAHAGVMASPGLAMGIAVRLSHATIAVERDGRGAAAERTALDAARHAVLARIDSRAEAGGGIGSVMRAHRALVEDPALHADAEAGIARGESAAYAWRAATRAQIHAIRATGNAHLIERIDDLIDIERQMIAALTGREDSAAALPTGAIVLAEDLLPSQLVAIAEGNPAGICLAQGGPTSHVAILCAGLGIPSLVAMGAGLDGVADGTMLLLDADAGWLVVDSDAAAVAAFDERIAARERRLVAARAAADQECRTVDGTRIELFANVGSLDDAVRAAANGAEGSGLVRSEFLFLDREDAPSEDEQHAAYQGIADALGGRPLIVRLLDIGGDKPAAYIPMAPEENPALGLRGIRVGLAHPELLQQQIRAILRVEPAGQCRIMAPMIASVAELRSVRAAVDRAAAALGYQARISLGVMVETPAAAITADLLSAECDFLSIGTNDLTQYVLAMDRGNPAVAAEVDAMHPAVLRMIAETCRRAEAAGRWVGLCGGLASDPLALPMLVGLGVSELSCVPGFVAEAKQIVRGLTMAAVRAHADAALACTSAAEVRALAAAFQTEQR